MAKHTVEVRIIYEVTAPVDADVMAMIGDDNLQFYTEGIGLPNVKIFSQDNEVIDIETEANEECTECGELLHPDDPWGGLCHDCDNQLEHEGDESE